jgi:cation:H+ antiporter
VIGVLLLLGSAVLLIAGAELFVENVAGASNRLGLTVLGVAVLLAGAEPEEALTGVLASAGGRPELAAGDAIGANVTLLTAALGLAALVRPLPIGRRVREYAVGSAVAGLLALAVLLGGTVQRWEGAALLGAYLVMVAAVWRRDRQPPVIGELAELEQADEVGGSTGQGPAGTPASAGRGLALALAGIAVMTAGGALAVDGAERVVAASGLADSAVGLTALALATTAELFALAWAALRRHVAEIAVAGLVGSAAYNATVSLGLAAVVHPLTVTGITASAVAAAVLPLVVLALSPRGTLGRVAGAVLIAGYVAFLVLVLR